MSNRYKTTAQLEAALLEAQKAHYFHVNAPARRVFDEEKGKWTLEPSLKTDEKKGVVPSVEGNEKRGNRKTLAVMASLSRRLKKRQMQVIMKRRAALDRKKEKLDEMVQAVENPESGTS